MGYELDMDENLNNNEKVCTYCKITITEKEIKKGKAHNLLGKWSHKECDENAFEKIDKNITHFR